MDKTDINTKKITKRKNGNHIRLPFFKKVFIKFWPDLSDKK